MPPCRWRQTRRCPSRRRAPCRSSVRARRAWRRAGRPSRSGLVIREIDPVIRSNCGCSTTSIKPCSPRGPPGCTSGTPATGCSSSLPSRTMRSRPTRSVTSIEPSGRNATDQGCSRCFARTVTFSLRSSADSMSRQRRGRSGVGHTIGAGASPPFSSCGAKVCRVVLHWRVPEGSWQEEPRIATGSVAGSCNLPAPTRGTPGRLS